MANPFADVSTLLTTLTTGQATLKADIALIKAEIMTLNTDIVTIKADIATIKADFAAHVAALPGLIAAQVAALTLLGAPNTAQRAALARRSNAVASSAPFIIVPLADGSTPAAWPPAFDRATLDALSADDARALLIAYGEPAGPSDVLSRRLRVARVIGASAPS